MSHHVEPQVGPRIRALRLERGLSQNRLADQTGIPKARISRYENGHVTPSVGSLDRLAAGLGLTLSELFSGIS
jgi:transcriptional regulator with XRE-family HTH domain